MLRRVLIVGSALLVFGLSVTAAGLGGALVLENQDSFCDSCHTEPEATFVNRSLSLPVDLASAHAPGVRCIDCHSGPGIVGRIRSLRQGVADLAAFATGVYTDPAVTRNPVGDPGCTKCHDAIDNAHYHAKRYIEAWKERSGLESGTCILCHQGHKALGPALGPDQLAGAGAQCELCHLALSGWLPE